MRAIIQRVSSASVIINGNQTAAIGPGLLVLLGVSVTDSEDDAAWLCRKLVPMRLFSDEEGKMNRSVLDVSGEILLVSQFTLHASTRKGNRPSFIKAARPDVAIPLYETCIRLLSDQLGKPIQTGSFGADMQVSLVNDGPVTILIDSEMKE